MIQTNISVAEAEAFCFSRGFAKDGLRMQNTTEPDFWTGGISYMKHKTKENGSITVEVGIIKAHVYFKLKLPLDLINRSH